jgi:hypothetical protein
VDFKVGDRVQVKASPVSVFKVLEVNGDEVVVIAEGDSPFRYPWACRATELIHAEG